MKAPGSAPDDDGANTAERVVDEDPIVESSANVDNGTQHKASTKKKKKKAKKVFVPLPSLESLTKDLNFSINFSQRLGRHATAKSALKAGDLILREVPVATVVRQEHQGAVCHNCFQTHRHQHPSVLAGYYGFCSQACSESNPARQKLPQVHGKVPGIARETDVDQSLLLFLLEVDVLSTTLKSSDATATSAESATASTGPVAQEAGSEGGVPLVRCGRADVDVLVSHWEHKSPEWKAAVATACKRLSEAISETAAYPASSSQKLQELAAIIEMNSHGCGVGNEENVDNALGLFPALSMFNHSCRPNASFAAVGQEMQVRALRDVRAGEQLFVSYINLTEDRSTRRQQLAHSKHFTCACERCTEPLETSPDRFLEGLACPTNGCPGPMVGLQASAAEEGESKAQEWKCCSCGKKEAENGREQLISKLKSDWQLAMLLRREQGLLSREAVKIYERILAQSPSILHPLHVLQIDCLMPLVNIHRGQKDLQGAAQHLSRLVSAIDTTVGIPTPELGNLLDLLSQLLAERMAKAPPSLAQRIQKQARDVTARAAHIRTLTLGPSHPLVLAVTARMRQLK